MFHKSYQNIHNFLMKGIAISSFLMSEKRKFVLIIAEEQFGHPGVEKLLNVVILICC